MLILTSIVCSFSVFQVWIYAPFQTDFLILFDFHILFLVFSPILVKIFSFTSVEFEIVWLSLNSFSRLSFMLLQTKIRFSEYKSNLSLPNFQFVIWFFLFSLHLELLIKKKLNELSQKSQSFSISFPYFWIFSFNQNIIYSDIIPRIAWFTIYIF